MKNILRALAVCPAMLALQVQSSSASEPLRFVFITTCVDEAFFKVVRRGMEDAANAMGVSSVFTGTHGVDIKAQAAMVRDAVKAGCDGIALNIIDPVGFDEVVKEAIDHGVPVVAFNIDDMKLSEAGYR